MRLTLLNKNVVPPGGFRAKCPHCSMWINAPTYNDMALFVTDHNRANSHLNWDWETALCEMLPEGCRFEDGSIAIGHDCRMDAGNLLAGMQAVSSVVWSMAMGRDVFVDQPEAERRAAICEACPKNVTVTGCGTCGSMTMAKDLIGKLKGNRMTTHDPKLAGCCCCLCDTKTIVWFKDEFLLKGMTEAQRTCYPEPCWKLALTVPE